jgi:hypothetical protein
VLWVIGIVLAVGAGASVVIAMRAGSTKGAAVTRPAAVVALRADRVELAGDHRAISRIGAETQRWTAPLREPVERIEAVGDLVIARGASSLSAIGAERGDRRFAWDLPTGQTWAPARSAMAGPCLTVATARGGDAVLHCLDPASGAAQWSAKLPGLACTGAHAVVPGMLVVQCATTTAIIDDHTGNVTVENDALGVIQSDPPLLLRERDGKLALSSYAAAQHRFAAQGTARGSAEAPTSALARDGKLIVRANASSGAIATILAKTGPPARIAVPELQLADDTPLVADCDLGEAPRFQLVALAPRPGATFDPELARQRVLALVDTDDARVAWASKRFVPPRGAHAGPPPCVYGAYVVVLDSGLWIVDAATGQTRAALAADSNGPALSDVTADQIGPDAIVAIGSAGSMSIPWRARGTALPAGVRDARPELERELGALP